MTWGSNPCASRYWTVKDTDSYRSKPTARTANPVLVVGNFGHTAYGTSNCVTSRVDRYVLTGKVPTAGTVCTSDFGAFEDSGFDEDDFSTGKQGAEAAAREEEKKQEKVLRELPPVVPPIQGASHRF